jgi:hypothetical protein
MAQAATGFSLWELRFDPTSAHVGLVVDKVQGGSNMTGTDCV